MELLLSRFLYLVLKKYLRHTTYKAGAHLLSRDHNLVESIDGFLRFFKALAAHIAFFVCLIKHLYVIRRTMLFYPFFFEPNAIKFIRP